MSKVTLREVRYFPKTTAPSWAAKPGLPGPSVFFLRELLGSKPHLVSHFLLVFISFSPSSCSCPPPSLRHNRQQGSCLRQMSRAEFIPGSNRAVAFRSLVPAWWAKGALIQHYIFSVLLSLTTSPPLLQIVWHLTPCSCQWGHMKRDNSKCTYKSLASVFFFFHYKGLGDQEDDSRDRKLCDSLGGEPGLWRDGKFNEYLHFFILALEWPGF